jgi:predicted kinase
VDWIIDEYNTKLMKECEHGYNGGDNPYHLEGSVLTHTNMVFEKIKEFTDDKLLLASAQLHDIGKPYARYEENNRAYFSGHEGISAYLCLDYVKKYNINPIELFKLVALHGVLYRYPKKSMIESCFTKEFWGKLSTLIKADHLGRITDQDKTSLLELLDFEYNFENSEVKFNKNSQYQTPYELKKELVVLIGPPNVGKSTYIENNSNNHKIISRDDLVLKYAKTDDYNKGFDNLTHEQHQQIDKDLQDIYRRFLKDKENIFIDMTNVSPKSRRKWTNLVKRSDYKIKFVLFLTSYNEIMRRNKDRGNKTLKESVIVKFMSRFTYPLPYKEKFDELEIVLDKGLK